MKLHLKYFATGLMAVSLLLSASSGMCQNKTIEKKKQEAGKLQEDIQFLDKQISQTKKQRQNTLAPFQAKPRP